MINQSARCKTGHFFQGAIFFLLILIMIGVGCNGEPASSRRAFQLPESGATTILIQFQDPGTDNTMPEAALGLASTSGGRFHGASESIDCFRMIASQADSAGKLLFVIIPEGEPFSGNRDHLVIWIDFRGIPVSVSPDLDSSLLADSLWENPIVRQQTILDLVIFYKPDMVLQMIPDNTGYLDITGFWSEHGAENDISTALFSLPLENARYRGWGIFTGKGVKNNLIEGMDLPGFMATFQMISGMNWNTDESGYPAMQAFYNTETE